MFSKHKSTNKAKETSAQKQRLDRTSMELLGNIQSTMMTRHQKAEVMIAGEQLRYAILTKLISPNLKPLNI